MELWELVARESIRDRIARWNANGDVGRFPEMVAVLAPDVEFELPPRRRCCTGGTRCSSLPRRGVPSGAAPNPSGGRYVPEGGPAVAPPLHQLPSRIDLLSETAGPCASLLPGGLVDGSRLLGPLPRRVRRGRRRVAHHPPHHHDRGCRSRRLGGAPRRRRPRRAARDCRCRAPRSATCSRRSAAAIPMRSPTSRVTTPDVRRVGAPAPTRSRRSCRRVVSAPGDVVAIVAVVDRLRGRVRGGRGSARSPPASTRGSGPPRSPRSSQRCAPAVLFHEGDRRAISRPAHPRPVVMPRAELAAAWQAGNRVHRPAASRRPEDPACIVWTSGTTGTPKGAWFDHRALRASAEMSGILSASSTCVRCRCRSRTPAT